MFAGFSTFLNKLITPLIPFIAVGPKGNKLAIAPAVGFA